MITGNELRVLLALAAGRSVVLCVDTHQQRATLGDTIRDQLIEHGLKVRWCERLQRGTVMPAEGTLWILLTSEVDKLKGTRASVVWAPFGKPPLALAQCVGPGGRLLE